MDLPPHPLAQGLNEAASLDPYLQMQFCDPHQGGWRAATELFTGNDARLKAGVMSYGYESWGTTNNHVAGSAFIVAYLTRVIYPVIGQYVLRRRVPRATLDNLAFHHLGARIDGTGLKSPWFAALAEDPAAGHPDAEVLSDQRQLYLRLKEWVFAANLEIVIESLHRSAAASRPVSRNAAAAACAQAFHRLFYLVEDKNSLVRDADTFFQDRSSPVFGQVSLEIVEHQGKVGLFGRRAGCCLIWRTDESDGYCSNCILRPKGEQTRQFQQMLARMP
jgi:hypothetical protein